MDPIRLDLIEGRANPRPHGRLITIAGAIPAFGVLDAQGRTVEPITDYLRDLALADASPLTVKSYGYDLLRWWRLLTAVDTHWDRATRVDVETLVGWMRSASNHQRQRSAGSPSAGTINLVTGKRYLRPGYSPRTINHQVSVLASFYAYHATFGNGPVVNPVPPGQDLRGGVPKRSPWETHTEARRAPLRQRVPRTTPRSIPDRHFDALLECMQNSRDRALLSLFVSSGARAAELLGLLPEHVDWAGQRIYVISKGSRQLEPVPVSPEALRYLALYLEQHGLPRHGEHVFRTLRKPVRPLTYGATRRIMQRANDGLGTNWTLHDLRHTLVVRLATDPALTMPEIMTVTRHRRVDSMTPYLQPRIDETFDKVQEHYRRSREAPTPSSGYADEDMRTVFGG